MVGAVSVAPVGAGNALTLPAHRHLVRLQPDSSRPAVHLLAVQQDRVGRGGLNFYRSDDEARSFRFYAAIQPDGSHADRADVLAVGNDLALVYSYEGSQLTGNTRHDVYFQWWRYQPDSQDWTPSAAVRVFDSTSASSAYSRGEVAVDSRGRVWVTAFRLESDGRSTAVLSVSSDDGRSFTRLPDLATVEARGGGRLLHLGSKLIALYDSHAYSPPARYRVHLDDAPVDQWSPAQVAFTDGIYHGAALSAVADGQGGLHLVYKDKAERLYYRRYDGSTFGPRTQLEDRPDWALQSATTRLGDSLVVFYNRMVVANQSYELRARTLKGGSFSAPVVLDGSANFKGYLSSPDVLPTSVSRVACAYGRTPDASSSGEVVIEAAPWTPTAPPPTDAGTPGPTDAGTPGPTDAGTSGPVLLFSDDFGRTVSNGLGAGWTVAAGLWLVDGTRAVSDLNGVDQALVSGASCADCRVEARGVGFGVEELGLFARARASAPKDRYDAVVLGNGKLRIRRTVGGATTVLGEAASGIASLDEYARLTLTVTGSGPVTLTASVNGVARLTVTDSSPGSLSSAGSAGLWTTHAGVVFDDFRLWANP